MCYLLESQGSPQSPSDVGLVTREPGEGSSDDLDESADLSMRKLGSTNQHRNKLPLSQSQTSMHRQAKPSYSSMRNSQPERSSKLFSQSQSRNTNNGQSGIPAPAAKGTSPSKLAIPVPGHSKPSYSRNSAPKSGLVAQYRKKFDSSNRDSPNSKTQQHTQSKPASQQEAARQSNQSQASRQLSETGRRDTRFRSKARPQQIPADTEDTEDMDNLFKVTRETVSTNPLSKSWRKIKGIISLYLCALYGLMLWGL